MSTAWPKSIVSNSFIFSFHQLFYHLMTRGNHVFKKINICNSSEALLKFQFFFLGSKKCFQLFENCFLHFSNWNKVKKTTSKDLFLSCFTIFRLFAYFLQLFSQCSITFFMSHGIEATKARVYFTWAMVRIDQTNKEIKQNRNIDKFIFIYWETRSIYWQGRMKLSGMRASSMLQCLSGITRAQLHQKRWRRKNSKKKMGLKRALPRRWPSIHVTFIKFCYWVNFVMRRNSKEI